MKCDPYSDIVERPTGHKSKLPPNNLTDSERSALVDSVRPWVKRQASRWSGKVHGMVRAQTFDDLKDAGMCGAGIAAVYFQPSKGFTFLTYAAAWISQQMQRWFETHYRLKGYRSPDQRNDPAPRVLSHDMDMRCHTDAQGEKLITAWEVIDPESIEPTERPDIDVDEAMRLLTARERKVLLRRYGYEHTLVQIGRDIGVTKERVRQIEIEALRKLRKELNMQKHRRVAA